MNSLSTRQSCNLAWKVGTVVPDIIHTYKRFSARNNVLVSLQPGVVDGGADVSSMHGALNAGVPGQHSTPGSSKHADAQCPPWQAGRLQQSAHLADDPAGLLCWTHDCSACFSTLNNMQELPAEQKPHMDSVSARQHSKRAWKVRSGLSQTSGAKRFYEAKHQETQ